MGNTQTITDEAQVDQALRDDRLIPPDHPDSLDCQPDRRVAQRHGPVQFRPPAHQPSRRRRGKAIAAVNLDLLKERTFAITNEHLAMREDCDLIADIGFVVPTEALAMALGVPSADPGGNVSSAEPLSTHRNGMRR